MNTNAYLKYFIDRLDKMNREYYVYLRHPLTGIVEGYLRCPDTDELIEKYGWEEVK